MSPTQLTLAYLRSQGAQAEVVERWNPYASIRQDLFGCIDIISVNAEIVGGVQCTNWGGVLARKDKINTEPRMEGWLKSGAHMAIFGWMKPKKRGAPYRAKIVGYSRGSWSQIPCIVTFDYNKYLREKKK